MTTTLPARYDRTSQRLHWASAVLVAGLWSLGQCIDFFPSGLPRTAARSVHIVGGTALALVLAARLHWLRSDTRIAPPPLTGPAGAVATWTHVALYALLVLVVALGGLNAWERGDSIFGLFRIPALVPGDKPLRELFEELHAWGANLLIGVAAVHAVAGLAHHFLLRDGVLQRMTAGAARKASGDPPHAPRR
jgi:cytochrome b561